MSETPKPVGNVAPHRLTPAVEDIPPVVIPYRPPLLGHNTRSLVTKDLKLDIIDALVDDGGFPRELAVELAERADRYFATLFPASVDDWVNACQREMWMLNHGGDPLEWDVAAARAGVYALGRINLGGPR